jgi:hypothetical protein
MISRKEGEWIVFYKEGEECFRCKIPDDATSIDIEKFINHLKKEVEKQKQGPN